jgi:3-oxoacyl-(acyl-carrier-protein) synthase
MNIYLRSTSCISPQKTFGQPPGSFLASPVQYAGTRLNSIEPDYRGLLDARLLRRMSRITRMGVAAAAACLQEAGEKEPDAIVTGTAYGCLEDTGLFLNSLLEREEGMLQPGPFIQSTHNTVGAQIALMLQCTRYNNTFVHRGLSFESALLDAVMLLQEKEAATVLVGGVDETTDISHTLLSRFGLYRRGAIAGEGASFFLLTDRPSPNDYARLEGIATFYKPGGIGEIEQEIRSFLAAQAIDPADIDLLITGRNGDYMGDRVYDQLEGSLLGSIPAVPYKHLCGEYPTSTAFAVWVAANIIREGSVPAVLTGKTETDPTMTGKRKPGKRIEKILVYNHYLTIHHSLFLLSA